MTSVQYTVEPLLKDLPRKGQPLLKGHFPYPQQFILLYGVNTYSNSWPQCLLYSKDPLYPII